MSEPAHHFPSKPRPMQGIAFLIVAMLAAALAVSGLIKIAPGVRDLTLLSSGRPAVDLHLRWVEWRYIFGHHQNPFDLYLAHEPEGKVDGRDKFVQGLPTKSTQLDPALGGVNRAPYPPWTYPIAAPVLSLPWTAARWAMASLSLAAIAVLAWWSWKVASDRCMIASAIGSNLNDRGVAAGLLAAAVAIGCAHHYIILWLGQPSGIVVAALALAGVALIKDRPTLAAMLMAIAMIKFTIAGPFVLILLVRRQWRPAGVFAAIIVLSTAVTWLATKMPPWRMLDEMRLIAEQIEVGKEGAAGPIAWFRAAGMAPPLASRVTTLLIVPLFALLLWWFRNRPTIVLIAIAAVGAQLWTHHKPYDEVVMLLLAAPLLGIAGQQIAAAAIDRSKLMTAVGVSVVAAAVALSLVHLGLPRLFGGSGTSGWVAFQVIAWAAGLVVVIPMTRNEVVSN